MATTPSAGPNARAANAHDHPAPRTSGGTSQIDAIVSANPTHVCVVRAVPTYAGGESSVIAVENWAESAMIVIPQTLASASVTSGGPPSVTPVTAAQVAEIAIATIVSAVRPQRPDATPPSQQPSPPSAVTRDRAPPAFRHAERQPPPTARITARRTRN